MSTAAARSDVQALPPSGVYSLKWNNFSQHLATGLRRLFDEDDYTDVTLACDGQFVRAHKFLLSLCSPFFKKLFQVSTTGRKNGEDTIVILNNVRFKDLENILRFIYNGEAKVNNVDLPKFLQTGELLQIEGLSGFGNEQEQTTNEGVCQGASLQSQSSIPPQTSPVSSPLQTRRTSVGHAQRTAGAASGSKPVKTPRLMSTQTKPAIRRMDQTYNSLPEPNAEVDPLEIRDAYLHNSSSCDTSHEDQGPEPEILMDMSDLKDGNFLVYSPETTNNEEVSFDNTTEAGSENVFDAYEGQQFQSGNDEISHTSKRNNGSQPRAGMTRNSSVAKRAVTTTATLKKKSRKPRNKYSKCLYCNAFIYRSNLSRHMATVHTKLLLAEGKRLFRCSICKATYRTLTHLQLHMQKHEAAT